MTLIENGLKQFSSSINVALDSHQNRLFFNGQNISYLRPNETTNNLLRLKKLIFVPAPPVYHETRLS